MKIKKLSEIIPLIEKGKTLKEIGEMLEPKRSPSTMWRYARTLRDAGYKLPTKKGRRSLKI